MKAHLARILRPQYDRAMVTAQRKTSLHILNTMTSIGWIVAILGTLAGVLLIVSGSSGYTLNVVTIGLGYALLGMGLTFVPVTFIVTAIYHLARANVAAVLKPSSIQNDG